MPNYIQNYVLKLKNQYGSISKSVFKILSLLPLVAEGGSLWTHTNYLINATADFNDFGLKRCVFIRQTNTKNLGEFFFRAYARNPKNRFVGP